MGTMKRAQLRAQAVHALRRVAAVVTQGDATDVEPSVRDALDKLDAAREAYNTHADELAARLRTGEAAARAAVSIRAAAAGTTVVDAPAEDDDDPFAGLRAKVDRARRVSATMQIARYRLCQAAGVAR